MDLNEIVSRMHHGQLYQCDNEQLLAEQAQCLDRLFRYNSLMPSQQAEKQALLRQMFAEIGERCYIETPFRANWGGRHVHFGNDVYANFNLVLVDDTDIYVADHVMMGPNVVLCTATHPIDPQQRREQMQYNLPIHIEENVWLGANCIVLPGVTIGRNSVIGAGSLVNKDIPPNVVAVGTPCRVLRPITPQDRKPRS